MNDELYYSNAILDGTLELICPEMSLLVCPSYHEIALKGTGVIKADKHNRLYFTMIAPNTRNIHPALLPSKLPGEICEPQEHVMLQAIDHNGNEWHSNWIVVNLYGMSHQHPNFFIQMHIEDLLSEYDWIHYMPCWQNIFIPNKLNLPFDQKTELKQRFDGKELDWGWNYDHHSQNIGEIEVNFKSVEEKWLVIKGEKQEEVMPDWPGAICQGLSLAMAREVRPVVVSREFEKRKRIQLFSGPFWHYESHLTLPVPLHPHKIASFWDIIDKFVSHIYPINKKSVALFEELSGIRRGAQGSIQTACLTIAVGIESLAAILLETEPVKTEILKNEIRSVLDHMKKWNGDPKLLDRALGLLGQLGVTRALDRLYSWAERTNVDKRLIDCWKRIRNPKAHGKNMSEDQSLYDYYYAVVELMYRLVASVIGYDGPIRQTSIRGWKKNMDH